MISYPKFKKIIMEKIIAELGEEFPDWELKEEIRYSINHRIDSLSVMPKEMQANMVMPSYRFEEMYSGYVNGYTPAQIARDVAGSMKELMEKAAQISSEGLPPDVALPSGLALDPDVKTATCLMINPALNKEFLKTVPHVDFLDLTIIFRIIAEGGHYAVNVTNTMLEESGMTAEELLKIACENTFHQYPTTIDEHDDAYIIGAEGLDFCSHVLCCDEALSLIATEADDDLFIMATSLRGILAIPVNANDDPDLNELSVKYWNLLRSADRLSPSVYYYDRENHKLTIYKDCQKKKTN